MAPKAYFSWWQIARLGVVQAGLGAIVIFATSTLNRVMVVEFALPAILPGLLVAFHYAIQVLRPRWGHGADRGGRQSPWIVGGMGSLAAGGFSAAVATAMLGTHPAPGLALAVVAFALIGVGVGAAGTSLLVLLAKQVAPSRRAPAATIVWILMIAGFIATAAVSMKLLDPFSATRLVAVAGVISAGAFGVTVLATWKIEPDGSAGPAAVPERTSSFGRALADVWSDPQARRFSLFVFVSMLAFSAQELMLEPFAGSVFAYTPGLSAGLAGLQHGGLLVGMVLVALAGVARIGSMPVWTIGGCLASALGVVGLAGVGCFNMPGALRICVFALGVGNGAFSIAAVASMMQLAGAGQNAREGVRMGLWGAAQAIAFACGGLLGTSASDILRHVLPPAEAYALVFIGEASLFVLASGLGVRTFSGRPRTSGMPEAPSSLSFAGTPAE